MLQYTFLYINFHIKINLVCCLPLEMPKPNIFKKPHDNTNTLKNNDYVPYLLKVQ